MAYEGVSEGKEVLLATETGDDGVYEIQTGCLTDATRLVSCVEVKLAQGLRAEWGHSPAAMSSATIRIGVQSPMTAGTIRVAPYTDSNSISNTNGETTGTISGSDVNEDRTITSNFISDCGTTDFTFRIFENSSGAKIKIGELSVQATIATIALTGITKDNDGVALGSVFCHLFNKTAGSGPYTFVLDGIQPTLTSNGSTGAYTFNYEDRSQDQMVYACKDDSPHVFDATDHVLTGS